MERLRRRFLGMTCNELLWARDCYRSLLAPALYPGEEFDNKADEGHEKHRVGHVRSMQDEETGENALDVHFIPPIGFLQKGEDTQLCVNKTAPERTHRLSWNEP